ncbi:MAG TPA: RICIN domain-containing protein, partial [Terracidiphilus sp.]
TAEAYTRCLAAPGSVEACVGTSAETWTVTEDGALKNAAGCLTADGHAATVKPCDSSPAQRWQYSLAGDLKNDSTHLCLTGRQAKSLSLEACGHNIPQQIWSLPN